jgi:hypothetical protein
MRILRKHKTVEVSIGDTKVFGLAALEGPHPGISVGSAGDSGVERQAESGESALTIFAETAADVEREADHITDLDASDGGADFDYLPEILMAQDFPLLDIRAAFVHVKIGTTDIRRSDFHEHIGRFLNSGIRHLGDPDIPRSVIHERFHNSFPPVTLFHDQVGGEPG